MKKNLLLKICILFIFCFSVQAKNVFLENETVLYEGYTLNFSSFLVSTLEDNDLEIVYDSKKADLISLVEIEQISKRRFKFAVAKFFLTDSNTNEVVYELEMEKRCLMVNCAVSDFGKILKKLIKKIDLNSKN